MSVADGWPGVRPEDQAIVDDLVTKGMSEVRKMFGREADIASAVSPMAALMVVFAMASEAVASCAIFGDIIKGDREPGDDPSPEGIAAVIAGILDTDDPAVFAAVKAAAEAAG